MGVLRRVLLSLCRPCIEVLCLSLQTGLGRVQCLCTGGGCLSTRRVLGCCVSADLKGFSSEMVRLWESHVESL